ncbi:MAG: GNAT family N-acetyltransferase [Lachnospiraceae bacterium]|nr:GNAT family N-acetyltransferase [Lachnospiraceae bacterium]
MILENGKIRIRNAAAGDAKILAAWWNDGSVMAHAGFPNGLGITEEEIRVKIGQESDETVRRHIIEYEGRPIGEMNYRNLGERQYEIGIKICDAGMQNRGLGKVILTMFIRGLFEKFGCERIRLDTNLKNTRAQHVYEELGFRKMRTNLNSWKDQLGRDQSSVDYELTSEDFRAFETV